MNDGNEEMNKNISGFKVLHEKSSEVECFSVLSAFEEGNKELSEAIQSGVLYNEWKKPVSKWGVKEVVSWLKMLSFTSEKFVRAFVEKEHFFPEGLLSICEHSAVLRSLPDRRERLRLVLNVLFLQEFSQKPLAKNFFPNEFDFLLRKILKKSDVLTYSVKELYSFAMYLYEPDGLVNLLRDQQLDEVKIFMVIMDASSSESSELAGFFSVAVDCPKEMKGKVHVGLAIGEYFIEWNSTELIVPRLVSNPEYLYTLEIVDLDTYFFDDDQVIKRIVSVLYNYNCKYHFSSKNRSHQRFVDDVCQAVGVTYYDPAVLAFTNKLKNGLVPLTVVPMYLVEEIRNWGPRECKDWSKVIGFPQLENVMLMQNITGEILLELDVDDEKFSSVIKDPSALRRFFVHFWHLKRNVLERGLFRMDVEFSYFAQKFLSQAITQKEATSTAGPSQVQKGNDVQEMINKGGDDDEEMSFYDMEVFIFKFCNKHMLIKYYLPFEKGDPVQILIVKKGQKNYQAAILLGTVILEWKSSEMIVPRFFKREDQKRYFKVETNRTLDNPIVQQSIIANRIVRYNSYMKFKLYDPSQNTGMISMNKNSLHFVEYILRVLSMGSIWREYPPHAQKYFDKIKRFGMQNAAPQGTLSWKPVPKTNLNVPTNQGGVKRSKSSGNLKNV